MNFHQKCIQDSILSIHYSKQPHAHLFQRLPLVLTTNIGQGKRTVVRVQKVIRNNVLSDILLLNQAQKAQPISQTIQDFKYRLRHFFVTQRDALGRKIAKCTQERAKRLAGGFNFIYFGCNNVTHFVLGSRIIRSYSHLQSWGDDTIGFSAMASLILMRADERGVRSVIEKLNKLC
jgi:hypothetical protein